MKKLALFAAVLFAAMLFSLASMLPTQIQAQVRDVRYDGNHDFLCGPGKSSFVAPKGTVSLHDFVSLMEYPADDTSAVSYPEVRVAFLVDEFNSVEFGSISRGRKGHRLVFVRIQECEGLLIPVKGAAEKVHLTNLAFFLELPPIDDIPSLAYEAGRYWIPAPIDAIPFLSLRDTQQAVLVIARPSAHDAHSVGNTTKGFMRNDLYFTIESYRIVSTLLPHATKGLPFTVTPKNKQEGEWEHGYYPLCPPRC